LLGENSKNSSAAYKDLNGKYLKAAMASLGKVGVRQLIERITLTEGIPNV